MKKPLSGALSPLCFPKSQIRFNWVYVSQSRHSCTKLQQEALSRKRPQRMLVWLRFLSAVTNQDEGWMHGRSFTMLSCTSVNVENAINLHLMRIDPL